VWLPTGAASTGPPASTAFNYWRFNNVAPAGARTMRISSFAWAPLGQTLPPVTNPPSGAPPGPGPGGPTTTGSSPPSQSRSGPAGAASSQPGTPKLTCVVRPRDASAAGGRSKQAVVLSLTMQPSRFAAATFARNAVLQWSATGVARLGLIVRRWVRGERFIRVGVLPRSVRSGSGRIHLPDRLAGRPIGPGTYSLGLASGTRSVRCTPRRFAFTVT
jgi:hypothetical protein